MSLISKFNIRVYGLTINQNNEILLTDEIHYNIKMTKFPGGGLQLGEGTIECLKREYIEEMNQKINILTHFYTTEFYHETKLIAEKQQLISIYYTTELIKPINFEISINRFSFKEEINGAQIFRWEKIDENLEKQLSFPIDKIVAKKLINTYK
jgi:ADP-ribose pyrophosphatase YjhB (NUDIX family)